MKRWEAKIHKVRPLKSLFGHEERSCSAWKMSLVFLIDRIRGIGRSSVLVCKGYGVIEWHEYTTPGNFEQQGIGSALKKR